MIVKSETKKDFNEKNILTFIFQSIKKFDSPKIPQSPKINQNNSPKFFFYNEVAKRPRNKIILKKFDEKCSSNSPKQNLNKPELNPRLLEVLKKSKELGRQTKFKLVEKLNLLEEFMKNGSVNEKPFHKEDINVCFEILNLFFK